MRETGNGPIGGGGVCRLCNGTALEPALRLAPTPSSLAYTTGLAAGQAGTGMGASADRHPIVLRVCSGCGHVQCDGLPAGGPAGARGTGEKADPVALVQARPGAGHPARTRHAEALAADILGRFPLPAGAPVLGIGSGDGTLLAALRAKGCRVAGLEPARGPAYRANCDRIDTYTRFLTREVAVEEVLEQKGAVVMVVATGAFAAAADLDDFTAAIRCLLTPGGLFVFEVPAAAAVLASGRCEALRLEHRSVHAVGPLIPFLAHHGLDLIEADIVPWRGGSLRGVARVAGAPWPTGPSVAARLAEEEAQGVGLASAWAGLGPRIAADAEALRAAVAGLRAEGRVVAGYGAGGGTATLLAQAGLDAGSLGFLVDDSPDKQGRLAPGTGLPVLAPEALTEHGAGAVVILADAFADSIQETLAGFRAGGGRVVRLRPTVTVV